MSITGLYNTYLGQSRLSNMQNQGQNSMNDIQTLEDQDPNEVRFDSRRPVETNIKDMLSQRSRMDATLSAGKVGGASSTPAPPATNPVRVESNRWFAPVFNKYADKAYQMAQIDPDYQKLKSDKDGDIIDKQKSFIAKLMAEKDIKPSMTEIYDEANRRGLTVSPTDNRFKTIGAAQDIGAYVNDLEIKSRGANQGVWSKYEFYALKPGSNSASNDELKLGYNKEVGQIQNENARRGAMGYSAELTTSPGNAAEAAIIADKVRQGKIEGQLDWGSTVWDKELGGRRGTVAQIPSFSEPLPQIAEPKLPKYEATGDDTIKIGVDAYNRPDKIPSSGRPEKITKSTFEFSNLLDNQKRVEIPDAPLSYVGANVVAGGGAGNAYPTAASNANMTIEDFTAGGVQIKLDNMANSDEKYRAFIALKGDEKFDSWYNATHYYSGLKDAFSKHEPVENIRDRIISINSNNRAQLTDNLGITADKLDDFPLFANDPKLGVNKYIHNVYYKRDKNKTYAKTLKLQVSTNKKINDNEFADLTFPVENEADAMAIIRKLNSSGYIVVNLNKRAMSAKDIETETSNLVSDLTSRKKILYNIKNHSKYANDVMQNGAKIGLMDWFLSDNGSGDSMNYQGM